MIDYFPKDTFVHRLPASFKLFFVLAAFFLSILFVNIYLQSFILFTILLGLLFARLPLMKVIKFSLIFLIFAPLMLFMHGAFYPSQGPIVFKFLVFEFYRSGLLSGLTIAFRLITIGLLVPLLVMTTKVSDLIKSMNPYLPKFLVFGLVLALRFIPLFNEEITKIRMAEKSRASKKGRFRNFTSLMVVLFSKILKRSKTLSYSIESRGFNA